MDLIKFVIVGHIDHGKSTLIGRLLHDTSSLPPDKIEEIRLASKNLGKEMEFAYLLDHLEEERREGITIDTTQVFFKTDKREYVIIDAPGHREFIKNMITGASYADAAVLIVDVKEGVVEQTKRHAYILSLLGIEQIIVVFNKMDLVDFKEEIFIKRKKEIEELFNRLNITPLFCIPISAKEGENIIKTSDKMRWYKGYPFLHSLDLLVSKEVASYDYLVFPVQDIYTTKNNKKLILGRVEAGRIKKDQKVKILPSNILTQVKSIEKYLENKEEAETQESIGITFSKKVPIKRGDIICKSENSPALATTLYASIFCFGGRKIDKDTPLIIRCATQELNARITSIKKRIDSSTMEVIQQDAEYIRDLEAAEVVIKTDKIVVEKFNKLPCLGRFVLVEDKDICGAGIVRDFS
jgi:sulfate adenylyltransferase large subunit